MNHRKLVESLARFAKVLPSLVTGIMPEDYRWRPASGNWSILEIVCHLADEEVEDFRTRLQLTLANPQRPWPAIDPQAAAQERNYNARNLEEVLQEFATQRDQSIRYLNELNDIDWQRSYQHPVIGAICAGDLLTSWAAHDQLHARQIAKRLFEMAERDGAPFQSAYAGQWSA